MTVAEKIALLKEKRAQAKQMGGKKRLAKQKEKGKLNIETKIDGVLTEVCLDSGDSVAKNDVLFIVEPK